MLFLMNLSKEEYSKYTSPMQSHINIGSGHDVPISVLAEKVKNEVGFTGRLILINLSRMVLLTNL